MTDLLTDKTFSRRSFLKGSGALVVGFSVAGTAVAGKAQAADAPTRGLVAGPPDPNAVDSWIQINPDNTATIFFGKVELGQGSTTGLLQIAAEELDLTMDQVGLVRHDTNVTPDQGNTAGSQSIQTGGPQVRAAAAEARQALLGLASAKLGVPVSQLSVDKGVVSGAGKSVKYGELIGGRLFNLKVSGTAPQKPVSQYKIVTTRVPRIDIPDKVSGKYTYMHNVRVPGMLHGRVVRPRGQAAYGQGAKPLSIDESSITNIPGAQVVRKGDFVGVVAPITGNADVNNSAAQYAIPNRRVLSKSVPTPNTNFLKTVWVRAPGAPQATFASEQVLDELAYQAGVDPIEFKRRNITNERWLGVLDAAAKAAKWQPRVANSVKQSGTVLKGRGVAIGGFANTSAAVIAEIEVNTKTGKIRAKHLYGAQDAGLVVNPAAVEAQIEGSMTQGASRALIEEIKFSKSRVTSLDWGTYPVLRFKDAPKLTPIVVQRTDQRSTGSGEPPLAPVPAAIANAFFDATGVRLRQYPMTPGLVRAALKAAGS